MILQHCGSGYVRRGWHSKADILGAMCFPGEKWNSMINNLLSSGYVKRQGERRDARYRDVGGDE